MRHWTMAAWPLAIAMTVTACSAEVGRNDNGGDRTVEAGPATTQTYDLADFAAVTVAGPDDVTIRRGDAFSISAKGPKAVIDELEIKRSGDTLSIGRRNSGFNFGGDDDGVEIAITMPALRALRLTGSGEIDADAVEGDEVEAVVTGSGDIKLASLNGKTARFRISGSGDIEVGGGTIGAGDYDVTGSGNIDAGGLAATTLDISIAGSGDVDAQASRSADISILGSGNATIGGGAKCSTRALGTGTATCK